MAVQPSVCEGPCRNHGCQKDAMHEGLWQYAILRVHRRERSPVGVESLQEQCELSDNLWRACGMKNARMLGGS